MTGMNEIRKVPVSAGAEWLLGGFALLRRAPLGLGLLGAIWGLLSMGVVLAASAATTLGLLLQLALALAGPLLFAGLVWAAHEVDQGRAPAPSSLLAGIREGHTRSLLSTLLPQALAGIVLGALLLALLGPDGVQHSADVFARMQAMSQSGSQPDPQEVEALAASLPAGRILLWLLLVFAAGIAVSLALFLSVPQILFGRATGPAAMRNSLRASLHNAGAVLVYLLLAGIALFAIAFATQIVALIAQFVFGMTVGLMIGQLLMMAVVMPLLAGSVYAAWKQLFAGTAGDRAGQRDRCLKPGRFGQPAGACPASARA